MDSPRCLLRVHQIVTNVRLTACSWKPRPENVFSLRGVRRSLSVQPSVFMFSFQTATVAMFQQIDSVCRPFPSRLEPHPSLHDHWPLLTLRVALRPPSFPHSFLRSQFHLQPSSSPRTQFHSPESARPVWILQCLVLVEIVLPKYETPETSRANQCLRHWSSLVGISPQTLQIRIVHRQLQVPLASWPHYCHQPETKLSHSPPSDSFAPTASAQPSCGLPDFVSPAPTIPRSVSFVRSFPSLAGSTLQLAVR